MSTTRSIAQQRAGRAWAINHPDAFKAWREKKIQAGTWDPVSSRERMRREGAPFQRLLRRHRLNHIVEVRLPVDQDVWRVVEAWIDQPGNMISGGRERVFSYRRYTDRVRMSFNCDVVATRFKLRFGGA